MIDKNKIYKLDENLPDEFWEGLDIENDWDVFKLRKRVATHNRRIQRGNSTYKCERVLKQHGMNFKAFPENGQINVYKDDQVFVYYSTTGTILGYKQKGFKAFCRLLGI